MAVFDIQTYVKEYANMNNLFSAVWKSACETCSTWKALELSSDLFLYATVFFLLCVQCLASVELLKTRARHENHIKPVASPAFYNCWEFHIHTGHFCTCTVLENWDQGS